MLKLTCGFFVLGALLSADPANADQGGFDETTGGVYGEYGELRALGDTPQEAMNYVRRWLQAREALKAKKAPAVKGPAGFDAVSGGVYPEYQELSLLGATPKAAMKNVRKWQKARAARLAATKQGKVGGVNSAAGFDAISGGVYPEYQELSLLGATPKAAMKNVSNWQRARNLRIAKRQLRTTSVHQPRAKR